jgi:Trp operon repressor
VSAVKSPLKSEGQPTKTSLTVACQPSNCHYPQPLYSFIMAPTSGKHKRLTQQERIAIAVLYLKGNWQQHELATQLGVTSSAISRTTKECKASVGDEETLTGLLACDFLRPTRCNVATSSDDALKNEAATRSNLTNGNSSISPIADAHRARRTVGSRCLH